MDTLLILTVLVVICALAFDFINGFHDTANAIATAVSTKALKPRHAIVMAAIMNFLGAMTFTGVAKTITKDIVDPFALQNGSLVILAALLAAIVWNLITWYYGIPSSSSHAIIGAIAGAAIAAAGISSLNYKGFIKILEALIISPIIAFVIGYIVYSIFKVVFKNFNLTKTNKNFRIFQIFTAALQAYTHGTNDAQKQWESLRWLLWPITIILLAISLSGYNYLVQSQWVLVLLSVVGKLLKLSVDKL